MNRFLLESYNDPAHPPPPPMELDDEDELEESYKNSLMDLGEGPLSHMLSFLNARELSQVEQTNRFLHQLSTAIAWPVLEQLLVSAEVKDSIKTAGTTTTSTLTSHQLLCRERVIRFTVAADYAAHMEQLARQHYDFDNPHREHVTCCCSCGGDRTPDHQRPPPHDKKNDTWSSWCPFPHKLHAKALYHPEQYDFFVRLSYRQAPPGWMSQKSSTTTTTTSLLIWQGFCLAHKQWSPGKLYFDLAATSLASSSSSSSSWQTMQAFLQVLHNGETQQSRNHLNAYRFQDRQEDMVDEDEVLNAFFSIDHPDVLALLSEALDNLSVTVVAVEKRLSSSSSSSSSPFGRPHLVLATGGFHDRVTETTAPLQTNHDHRQEIRLPSSTATSNTALTRNTTTATSAGSDPRIMTTTEEEVEDELMPDVVVDPDIRTTNVHTTTTSHSSRERLAFSLHPRNVCTHGGMLRQEEDWMSVELYTDAIRSKNQDGGGGGSSKGSSRWKGSNGDDTHCPGKFRGLSVSHEWE